MANPEIQFLRDKATWTLKDWERYSAQSEEAARLATQGIKDLGVSYRKPKVGTVFRYKKRNSRPYTGLADNPSEFDIRVHVPEGELQESGLSVLVGAWTVDALHEVLHCIRNEHTAKRAKSRHDAMAHEGLAYIGEYMFGRDSGIPHITAAISEKDLLWNPELEAAFREVKAREPDSSVAESWHQQKNFHPVLTDYKLHAVQLVHQQIQAGHELDYLLRQPSKVVLGL